MRICSIYAWPWPCVTLLGVIAVTAPVSLGGTTVRKTASSSIGFPAAFFHSKRLFTLSLLGTY